MNAPFACPRFLPYACRRFICSPWPGCAFCRASGSCRCPLRRPCSRGVIGSASGLLKCRGFPSTSTANGQDCCHLLTPFPEIAGNTISYLLLAGKQERQREKLLFRAGNMPSAGKGRAGCRLLGGKQRARLILRAEDRLYTKASPAHWMEKDR